MFTHRSIFTHMYFCACELDLSKNIHHSSGKPFEKLFLIPFKFGIEKVSEPSNCGYHLVGLIPSYVAFNYKT